MAGPEGDWIEVRGAREHNLRGVSCRIPRGRLTVVTGLSGSGKSSLAFDTLFAEGQRRYLESLPARVRAHLEKLPRPDVDFVDGLAPAIAIGQFAGPPGPRATLATAADLHDHLRLLFAHLGTPHCPVCGRVVRSVSPGALAERLLAEPEGTKLTLCSPMLRSPKRNAQCEMRNAQCGKPGARRKTQDGCQGSAIIAEAAQAGFVRVRIDGAVKAIEDVSRAEADAARAIDAVVDRIVVKEGVRTRLADSVELAMARSGGEIRLLVQRPGGAEEVVNESERFSCPDCGVVYDRLSPASFSFSSHAGACPACEGLGSAPDGSPCPACGGARLRPEPLACRLEIPGPGGPGIADVLAMTVSEMRAWAAALDAALPPAARAAAGAVAAGLRERLDFLDEAGLGYLRADRAAATLSGGELRRVRLSAALGQRLGGVLYVLDEPTSGLHPHDVGRLAALLARLRDRGNTVVAVEHDETVVRAADWAVELGPGAGSEGGRVVYEGPVAGLSACAASPTGRRLAGAVSPPPPARPPDPATEFLAVEGARAHNLRAVSARFPVGRISVVTGVSGSGKSSLVRDVLGANLTRLCAAAAPRGPRRRGAPAWTDCDAILGAERFAKVVEVGTAARSRNPRSVLLTFIGAWDAVRALYAATPLARARGYTASRFSFNAKGGRCEACKGEGVVRLEMSFLPDATVPCEACGGRRFNRETLDVHWAGRSVADLLELSAAEAADVFRAVPPLRRAFATLADVGLGYLKLGQPVSTLSGGEAQRLLLAAGLARPARELSRTLYLLDEPSSGQHADDIDRLLAQLARLRDGGATVVVVDHRPQVMRAADWIVDLGPGGGDAGGRVLAQGVPSDVRRCRESLTARYL